MTHIPDIRCQRVILTIIMLQFTFTFFCHVNPFHIMAPCCFKMGGLSLSLSLSFFCKVLQSTFFLIKPTDTLLSQIYFCQESLHVSGSSSSHHQEFPTVSHAGLMTAFKHDLVMLESCHQTCMTYTSAKCTVGNS